MMVTWQAEPTSHPSQRNTLQFLAPPHSTGSSVIIFIYFFIICLLFLFLLSSL